MRTAQVLTGIFSSAVGVALATSACSVDVSNIEPPPHCSEKRQKLLVGLQPPNPADYLEYRMEFPTLGMLPGLRDAGADSGDGGARAPSVSVQVVESAGVRCGGAKDAAACNAALDALRLPGCGSGSGGRLPGDLQPHCTYFVYTRGDVVGTLSTLAELRDYLGTVDNADEAILLASWEHGVPSCNGTEREGWRPAPGGGYEIVIVTGDGQCENKVRKRVKVASDGEVSVLSTEVLARKSGPCTAGRRPSGLVERDASCKDPVGAFFSRMAHLEAASVAAFRVLERELHAHGAPRGLRARALRAAKDEIAHARTTASIARRFGGTFVRPRVEPRDVRSLEDVAIENATEGCVNETWGALVATFQARVAGDRRVRAAMARIARDETRHAALAQDVAAWIEPRLSVAARRRVEEARAAAAARLRAAARVEPHPDLARVVGLPTAVQAEALLDAAGARLWAA
jgi:hypothetical protein